MCSRRPICQPNTGFTVQLIEWAERRAWFLSFSRRNDKWRHADQMPRKLIYQIVPCKLNEYVEHVPKLFLRSTTRSPLPPNSNLIQPGGVFIIVSAPIAVICVGRCSSVALGSNGLLCANWLRS